MKLYYSVLLLTISLFFFTGCLKKKVQPHLNTQHKKVYKTTFFTPDTTFNSLNKAIKEISNQLLLNIDDNLRKQNKIAITTFVNLEHFKSTSPLGRVISESLIDELHIRRFQVIDYRQQGVLSIDQQGEFILTRDVDYISDEIPPSLIVVGTYSIIQNKSIILNARILNNETLDVLSTAKVILDDYKTCLEFNLCTKESLEEKTCIDDEGIYCDKKTYEAPILEDCTKFDCVKNQERVTQ
jgi:TolB-like protein